MTDTNDDHYIERISKIVAETANVSRDMFGPDDDLSDKVGLDSLDAVEIIMDVEEEFDISIPDEEVGDKLKSVRQLVELVKRRLEG